MWNEKGLKNLRPKMSKPDAIDEEAERQGNAMSFFRRNELGPSALGKAISKQRRAADGNHKGAELRATKNLVRDTAEVAKRIVSTERNLRIVHR